MAKIHQLSPELIAKIAAGEVIERPAYAIKELIENAVDAQASTIKIELLRAGLDKIIITDNGIGMDKEDIRECFKPHTTSKISNENDLFTVNSMGFRGEALASIATISDMTIRSRYIDDTLGTEIDLKIGNIEKMGPFGMPIGTEIIIRNIFNNVPARKKFINSPSVEFRLILEMITALSLALPGVGFSLYHNKRQVLDLPSEQSLLDRASLLFGTEFKANLLPVLIEDSYLKISGYIAKPQLSTRSGSKQYLFINKRKIIDKQLIATIKDTYGTLLEPRVHPIFILFFDMPYERVDVNIHPRKEQVAFTDPQFLVLTLRQAVISRLSTENLIYNDRRWQSGEYSPANYQPWSLRDGGMNSFASKLLKETTPWTVEKEILKSSDILQMHNLYLIAQTKNGIILIVQHAAHERILYEQFLLEFRKVRNEKVIYIFESPVNIELSIHETQALRDNVSEIAELGFDIDADSLTIKSLPEIFKDRNPTSLLRELLEDLIENRALKDIDSKSNKMIAYLACRTAIKAGDKLSKEQAHNLIEKLNQCKTKFTCPHGRPVQIEISLNELHHKFHRR
ncbi:MAG: DNA mismatch repair endonuclease MutL [bacterium]|nr:DNA mismatch repair endonuclease MutL [bacterium]